MRLQLAIEVGEVDIAPGKRKIRVGERKTNMKEQVITIGNRNNHAEVATAHAIKNNYHQRK